MFQACCLNFDQTICELFGETLSLQAELAFALQFTKLNFDQVAIIQKYQIPEHIEALDARLNEGLSEEQKNDMAYRFRVVYMMDNASKSQAHIQFIQPNYDEAAKVKTCSVKI